MAIDERAFQLAMIDDDAGKPRSSDGRIARQRRFLELYEAARVAALSDEEGEEELAVFLIEARAVLPRIINDIDLGDELAKALRKHFTIARWVA